MATTSSIEPRYGLQYVVDDSGKRILGKRKDRGHGVVKRGHYCRRVKRTLTKEDKLWCTASSNGRARRRRLGDRDPLAHRDTKLRAKDNAWIQHVKKYRSAHPNVSWKDSLTGARVSYNGGKRSTRHHRSSSSSKRAPNPWIIHVKSIQAKNRGMLYSRALELAKNTYKSTVKETNYTMPSFIALYSDPLSQDGPPFPSEAQQIAKKKNGTLVRVGFLKRVANGTTPARVHTHPEARVTNADIGRYRRAARLNIGPRLYHVDKDHSTLVVAGLGDTLWATLKRQGGTLTIEQQRRIADICEHPQVQLGQSHSYYPLHCFVVGIDGVIYLIHMYGAVIGGEADTKKGTNKSVAKRILDTITRSSEGDISPELSKAAGN